MQHARAHDDDAFEYRCLYLVPRKDHHTDDLGRAGVRVEGLRTTRAWGVSWVARALRVIDDWRPDIIHVHSPLPAALVRLALRTRFSGTRPRLMYTEHNRWGQYRLGTRIFNAVTYPLDDLHIAVSEGVADTIPSPLRAELLVVHHGIDREELREMSDRAAARRALGAEKGDLLVGTVANLRREKDYPNLMRAARSVLDERPEVRFVAAGQGPLEQEIHEEHRRLGLADNFQLLGYRPDARRLIAGFDLFVLGSEHEGLPVAVMEAMTLGVPVVATAVGGLSEAVEDGKTGWLVPPKNPRALADAIIALIDDPATRNRMGKAAAEASARFDATRTTRQIETLYERLSCQRQPVDG